MVLLLSIKKIAVVQEVSYSECSKVVDKILNEDIDFVILCGGLEECIKIIDVPKRSFGIVKLEDDVYIIKLMKSRGIYISGRWKEIEKDLCIGGIDAKNPIQNLSMVIEKPPKSCKNIVLVTHYPQLNTKCSLIKILEKKISLGLNINFIDRLLNQIERLILICCNSALDKSCIDFTIDEKLINIVLVRHFAKLIIDFNNVNAIAIED